MDLPINNKKIVVNARFLSQPVTGVQRYGIECSRKIKKLYPDAVFVTPHNILNTTVAAELDALIVGSNTGHLWEQFDLPVWLKKNNSPALFSPCNTAPLLYKNNFITIHDLAFYYHPEWNSKAFSTWYNLLIPRIARRSRHLFTVSGTVCHELSKNYNIPESHISVTYNGIGSNMLVKAPSTQWTKERIILAVGSFNVRKNHQSLIKVFLETAIKDEYKLVIIGDRNKVFRETGINEIDLKQNNIEICRNVTEAELVAMYMRSEIVVSLSVYEGFGIPTLEGVYFGCKAVCSDIPVYRELYDGVAAFCDPFDVTSIARAIRQSGNSAISTDQVNKLVEKYSYNRSAEVILNEISKTID
jgi:glycosyltransferase involved in cell wall biosynthesis